MTAVVSIADRLNAAEDLGGVLPPQCPVKPLGHRQGQYYFISPVGELRQFAFRDFSHAGISSLFEGRLGWLEEHFPRKNKDGEITGFSHNDAAAMLINACCMEGLYDATLPVRGPGVWRTTTKAGNDAVLVHCGDVLFCEKNWVSPGVIAREALYAAYPPIDRLAETPATPEDGQRLLQALQRWAYERPAIDGLLILGFIAEGMLGAAAPWRAHLYVNGEFGSGKSALVRLVSSALGSAGHDISNNFTEAGLRQQMTEQARAFILDEAEQEDGGGRIAAVIEMLRHMSGEGGMKAVRGSSGGVAQRFNVTGCAYLSSILRVPLRPQDRSRITQIVLRPLSTIGVDADAGKHLLADRAFATHKANAFRRRMVDKWALFSENFDLYRAALMGCDQSSRYADQFSVLLAGKETLLNDLVVDTDTIAEDLEALKPLMVQAGEDVAEGEGDMCLNHLYSSPVDLWRSGDRQTVGQILQTVLKKTTSADMAEDNARLGLIGLKVCYDPDNRCWCDVMVANQHEGLKRIFHNTRWANGGWVGALEYLGGGKVRPLNYAGAKARGTRVPHTHWPKDDKEGL